MTRPTLAQIKANFETGDVPNGADYAQLIDTLAAQATELGSAGNNEEVISGIENETTIDSFVATEWRMIKYLVSISKTDGISNKFYATELTLLIDETDVSVTEYGITFRHPRQTLHHLQNRCPSRRIQYRTFVPAVRV